MITKFPSSAFAAHALLTLLIVPASVPGVLGAKRDTGALADVSLLQLIATPERFDGKLVRVKGYCRLAFEGTALYLHQQDYEHGMPENSVWLEISRSEREGRKALQDKYVIVEARFGASERGHFGMFSGSLKEIARLELWSDPRQPISTIEPKLEQQR